MIKWSTQQLKLAQLVPWEDNPVELTEHDARQLAQSIRSFGLAHALIANAPQKAGQPVRILDGHQRKRVLVELLGFDEDAEVDVRIPSRRLTKKQCDELTIRLRRNTGRFDFDILANRFEVEDLLEWGFQRFELDLAPTFDAVDAWGGMPEFDNKDLRPARTLYVHFRNEADVAAFAKLLKQQLTPKTRYVWYPAQEKTAESLVYVDVEADA